MIDEIVDHAVGVVELVGPRGGVPQDVRLGDELAAQQGDIAGGREVGLLALAGRQSVGRVKLGVRHAKLAGLGVHEFHKRLLRTRRVDGEGHGGVIG